MEQNKNYDGMTTEMAIVDDEAVDCEVNETSDGAQEETDVNEFINDTNSFIDPEDYDSVKLLGLKSKLNDISRLTNQLKSNQNGMLKGGDSGDVAEYLDSVVLEYTVDELKELTNEDLDNIYVYNDEEVEFGFKFDDDDKRYEFKRDYLVMRKETMDAIARFDEESAKINEELANHQDELNHLLDEYGDMDGLIRSKLNEKIESATNEETKNLYIDMLVSFDNASNLLNVAEYIRSYKGKDIIPDYRNDKNSKKVYAKYMKVMESLEITTNLTSFRDLEKKFLVTDDNYMYCKRPNIFIFSVIHYIASWYNKQYSKVNGLFVTQLIINLKNLYYDKFKDEATKENFIKNIKSIIDIIG